MEGQLFSREITNMAKKMNTMLFKSADTNNGKVRQTLSNRSRGICADLCRTLLVLSLCVSLVSSEVVDLCNVNGCVCTNNPSRDDLIDVNCQCQNDQVSIIRSHASRVCFAGTKKCSVSYFWKKIPSLFDLKK